MTLTNSLELPDRDMTLENYDEWITKLNITYPEEIANLLPCDLEKFLSEVLLEHCHYFSEPNSLLHHRVSSFFVPQSASGTGLAFIAFTEAVKEMPAPQVWAILFFVMLFTLGLSSMFGNMEGILSPLKDLHVLPKWLPNEVTSGKSNLSYGLLFYNVPLTEKKCFLLLTFSGILCVVSFSVALIFTQGSGNYWVEVFNGYVGSVPLLVIAFFEIVGVSYIYGIRK